jgi:DNA-binding MarR family transcriptional regulator
LRKPAIASSQLLAEVLNSEIVERMRADHLAVRHSHGFLFQQLVEGPRPVGEVAENLGVSSQAISKAARELEGLGYVQRTPDAADARVRRLELTARGRAAVEAAREIRAALNAELAQVLGAERAAATASTLREALAARGAMSAVEARRVRSAQGLRDEGR